jgi:molybdopterin/thiamine biosynthesis adenylyltransferase
MNGLSARSVVGLMTVWWERFPGLLKRELSAFEQRGLKFERDESMFRDAGRLLLRGSIDHDGQTVELEVLYPDLFPYVRPEVYAPDLSLERHQNPAQNNLCLLESSTRAWRPDETGAWLVAERVPLLLSLFEQGPEAMAAAEVPQGEPVSVYFRALRQPGTVVFVPGEALELDPHAKAGSGRLRTSAEAPFQVMLRALLSEVVTRPGGGRKTKRLAHADAPLQKRFAGRELQMRWVRLDAPPGEFSAEAVFAAAERVQRGFGRPPWQRVADGEVAVTGVVFAEEVRQGEWEDAWLFAVRARRTSAGSLEQGEYVIPGERVTPDDLGARIPRLASLGDAVVAQVGLGALGAPLAVELARNQLGALRLLEDDFVEAAQIPRWPFGLQVAGRLKVNALAEFIELNYPYTKVDRWLHRLGQTAVVRHARAQNELDLLADLLDGVTLVIDATAELRIQQLVADFARERGLPQLFLSATEGARGGQVALIVPSAGGCWFCWRSHTQPDAEGRRLILPPPFDADGTVQPRGCASPTFTGASFDLAPIVAQAARVAAAAVGAQAPLSSTVWRCSIPEDNVEPPTWETLPVPVHPDCPLCAAG